MESEIAPPSSWIFLAVCLLISLLLITPILVSRTPFLSDDYSIVATNIEDGKLSVSRMVDHFTVLPYGVSSRYYRPIYWLSYAPDFLVGGTEPIIYYVIGAFLHGLTAWFLFLFLRLLGASFAWSALSMAVFLCHPIHFEPLTWIAARSSTLSATFALGALAFFAAFRRGRGVPALVGFAVFFALGLLTREIVIIVPGLLVALDLFVRFRDRKLLPPYIISMLIIVGYMAARSLVLGGMASDYGAMWLNLFRAERIGAVLYSFSRYFVPFAGELEVYQQALIALPTAVLVISGFIAMRDRKTRGILLAMICCFALASLPSLPILVVTEDLTNSRFFYLTSAALSVFIAAGAMTGRRYINKAAIVLVLFGGAGVMLLNQRSVVEAGKVCKAFLSSVRATGASVVVVPRMKYMLYADSEGDGVYNDEPARFAPVTAHRGTGELAVLLNVPRAVDGVYVFFTSLDTALSPIYGAPGVQVLFTEMAPEISPSGSFLGLMANDGAPLLKWDGQDLLPVSAEVNEISAAGMDINMARAESLGTPELPAGDTFDNEVFHPVMTLPSPSVEEGSYRYRMLTPFGSHGCLAVPRVEGDQLVFDPMSEVEAGALFQLVKGLEPGTVVGGQALPDFDPLYCILFIEKVENEAIVSRTRHVLFRIDF